MLELDRFTEVERFTMRDWLLLSFSPSNVVLLSRRFILFDVGVSIL